ncbi:head GIN domain-containing protein [Leeuwenhoekiella sp. MAR_2009_132]|uniref:head GIN domain-containing protein n=1 Tax=Leeuwenhoekiella sp. MAR_2009_132 TaxID=1392489 RepID=UPI00048B4A8D|nr:head GIN domain-containing protein [Leeuwenhoekiella sp. MAR_2009_132]
MRKLTLLVALVLIAATANAQSWGSKKIQGNGNLVTNNRDLGNYDEIGVAGSFDVILIAGKEGKITVEAEANLQEYIITEVKGDKLKIYTKDGYNLNTSRNNGITITVPFEDINKVSMAGSGDVIGKDLIAADHFECAVAGSGDMVLEVNAKDVSASVAGSGDLTISGKSERSILKVAGSGDLDASDLKSIDAEASVAGSGDISLNCDGGDLKASVAGSGDIRYSGKPNNVNSKVVGSGSVSN